MNAPAFAERHCSQCRRMKPVDQFRSHAYCVDCRSNYCKSRYVAVKEGKWVPKTPEERAKPAPRLVAVIKTPVELSPPIPDGGDDQLRDAMLAFMQEFGFTSLKVTCTRLEGELARAHRFELAREGWIA